MVKVKTEVLDGIEELRVPNCLLIGARLAIVQEVFGFKVSNVAKDAL